MKYLKKLLFSLLLLIPFYVYAAGSVDVNKTSITLNTGGTTTFTITATNAAGRVNITSNNTNVVTVDKTSEWVENGSITVTVTAKNPGSTTIKVDINAATFDEEVIKTTKNINVTVNSNQSSNNLLSSLKVDNTLVNGFSSTVTSYSMSTSKSSVSISATAQDNTATISGTGTKNLSIGSNPFSIVVTAQNGTKKTYYLTITRTATASSNNNLSSLKVDNVLVSGFSSSVTTYTVNTNKSSAIITAATEDTKATVTGTGTKTLSMGLNTFSIVVTAENGAKKTYTLNINRSDPRSSNNNLSSLKVNNVLVSGFSSSVTSYTLNNDGNSVVISATAEDTKATISGTGTKTLNYGLNTFNIVVTAENGTKKTYTLSIMKADPRSSNNNLSSIKIDDEELEKFSASNLSYGISTIKPSVVISATAEDQKAKITGTGSKTLKYGSNSFSIVVTAENGAKKTYTVSITREDGRDSNNDLESITVGDNQIMIETGVTSYLLEVDNSVTEVNIVASPGSVKSTVTGTGIKKLNVGNNDFTLVVTAENEAKKTYTIRIVRKSETDTEMPDVKQYSINYNSASYSYCPTNSQISYFVNENDKIGTLCTPVREGYKFNGWYDQDNNLVTSDTIVTKNLVLTARFTEENDIPIEAKSSNNDLIMTIVIVVLFVISAIVIGNLYLQNKKR